ncbi:hypothetical protein DPMN_094573 [Dreissena polymorpha]|uniref:B box-type domain-containing protein n=1 Tax=Dreissena polymorpha TaxID=45954 RepID=A0A9D4R2Z2_DREPO|nr:hypothetical protein DPMN_094573 [Dreissena polymorpha]
MEMWPIAKATRGFLENCQCHRGKKLKYFCEDHSKLCCSVCNQVTLRQCTKADIHC